jgi:hypothetical protein
MSFNDALSFMLLGFMLLGFKRDDIAEILFTLLVALLAT